MNCNAFKDQIIWNNVGEVAIQSGIMALSVYQSTLLRQVMRSFTGVSSL